MGCRAAPHRSRSTSPAMRYLWNSGPFVVLALLFLLLGPAGTLVESRPVKLLGSGLGFGALHRPSGLDPGSSRTELRRLQAAATTTTHHWREPTPPAAKIGKGQFHSHAMKFANFMRLDDDIKDNTWFRVPSPPGPGTSEVGPPEPAMNGVRSSLHVVPSGPNPLHN